MHRGLIFTGDGRAIKGGVPIERGPKFAAARYKASRTVAAGAGGRGGGEEGRSESPMLIIARVATYVCRGKIRELYKCARGETGAK
jgi:hypothetical protein